MKIKDKLLPYLNVYSVIGAVAYGCLLTSNPTPEVVNVITPVGYFVLAASFYISMYVLYAKYRWKRLIIGILLFFFMTFSVLQAITLGYMIKNKASKEHAEQVVATYYNNFLYYLPFLP